MAVHRTILCLAIATAILAAVTAVLLGLLIWRQVEPTQNTDQTKLTGSELEQRFPGYFRTPEQQARFVKLGSPYRPVLNVSKTYTRCFTNGYCEKQPSKIPVSQNSTLRPVTATPSSQQTSNSTASAGRRKRQVNVSYECMLDNLQEQDLTFHGCCISYSDYIIPDSMPTAEPGQTGNVTIAQPSYLNQYFEIQHCCQALNCSGCQCAQTNYVVSAVVIRPASGGGLQYLVEYVRVPGCCQCLNTFPAVS